MTPAMKILALALLVVLSPISRGAEKPNIVLVFADDLGWKDVAFHGADFFETPHLDKLASEGMVFTAAYAAAGNCAPSRACLLSGSYTPRHHVYAVGSTDRGPKASMRLVPVPNRNGLPPSVVTVADALKAAGYATGHFGKWHLAGKDGALPTEQGFDVSFDSFGEGELKEGSEGNKKGPPEDPKGVYALTRKACAFIEEKKEGPFFCYLAHHAIHGPLQGKPEVVAHFKSKTPGEEHKDALYAACVHALDDSVGLLVAKLRELDLEKNTLLVFTSDNGATQQSSQEPLRGSKGGYYEGGIREPFIAFWPGVVAPGTRCDTPVINVDLYPTFLDVAGASPTEGVTLDGESLLPLFKGGKTLAREALFWHFPGYLDSPVLRGRELDVRTGFRSRPVSVIHKGDWKLHLYHEEWMLDGGRDKLPENGAVELYNLAGDIGERVNVAATEPEKRDALLADLLAWQKSIGAIMPTEANPAFEPDVTAGKRKGRKKKKTEP